MGSLLDERITGSSGISIGTHLALETIFSDKIDIYDKDREFEKVNINNFKYHVFNLYTIVRNLLNSCLHKQKDEILMDKKFISVLSMEIELINSLYDNTKCDPILFYPDYSIIYKRYNVGKETAITQTYKEHVTIRNTLHKHEKLISSVNNGKGYRLINLKNLKPNDKILITTNIACDLFNKFNLELLESHTGKIKKKYEFNTKYHTLGAQDLTFLPFVEELMYILGDKCIITPLNVKMRRLLFDIASNNKWTVRTTSEKVRYELRKEKEIWDIISQFSHCY